MQEKPRYEEYEPRKWGDRQPSPGRTFALYEPGRREATQLLYSELAGDTTAQFEASSLRRIQDAIDPDSYWVYVPDLPEEKS